VYEHLRTRDDNPCVVIPTGGGKTPVIATICRDAVAQWGGRVVLLAHVKELLEQAADKLRTIASDVPMGIYSAGLKRKDLGYAVTVAGIQSIWKKACDLGPVDLIIVDEAHMVPAEDDGMYRQFIADAKVVNPNVRIIGLTATPYRMKSGSTGAAENILNHVCFEVGVRELIVHGFLSPLRTKAGLQKVSTDDLHVRAGEFVASEVEDLMDKEGLVEGACAEIVEHTKDRSATLIFSSGIRHGQHIVDVLKPSTASSAASTGDTPTACAAILAVPRGELKYLQRQRAHHRLRRPAHRLRGAGAADHVAGPVLPDGGPGLSTPPGQERLPRAGLRRQRAASRPRRRDPHRHRRSRRRRSAREGVSELPGAHRGGYQTCLQWHQFPDPNRQQHEAKASTEGILSGQTTREEHRVSETTYHVHYKRSDPSAPLTMRVEYRIGFNRFFREWVCFDHTGTPARKRKPGGGHARSSRCPAVRRRRSTWPRPARSPRRSPSPSRRRPATSSSASRSTCSATSPRALTAKKACRTGRRSPRA
jgi:DNA repair protein RadD